MFIRACRQLLRPASRPRRPQVVGSRPRVEALEERALLSTGTFAIHVHPDLTVTIDGEERTIPANVGISGGEFEELHTHDTTGTLHVESEVVREFNLGEFLDVWDRHIAANIQTDATGALVFADPAGHETRCRLIGATMQIAVNGQPAPANPDAVMLQDLDNVVIRALTRGGNRPDLQ